MSVRDDILTALEEQLLDINGDPAFDSPAVASVMRYWPQLDDETDDKFPMIVIDDNGNQPGPEHAGVGRFTTLLNINCITRSNTAVDMLADLETLANGVLKYLYSKPELHDNVLSLKVIGSEDQGAYSNITNFHASIMPRIRIIWHDTMRTVAAASGTDVYGTQWLDTARDKLVARIETLKTTMATGYSPTFGNVYARHKVPDLVLNAVSVGIADFQGEHFADGASGANIQYLVTFTVRVHTAYSDELVDDQEVGRLVNSLINHLRNKLNLADEFRIFGISGANVNAEFTESESKGAEFAVVVGIVVRHTQE